MDLPQADLDAAEGPCVTRDPAPGPTASPEPQVPSDRPDEKNKRAGARLFFSSGRSEGTCGSGDAVGPGAGSRVTHGPSAASRSACGRSMRVTHGPSAS